MRSNRREGITNGVALILVILVVAVPSTVYLGYFNKPITTAPSQTSTSTTITTAQNNSSTPAAGFESGGLKCGFGLLFGSPGGAGCIIYVLNNNTASSGITATPTGTCALAYEGSIYQGTFSYADALAPGASTGKATCGASQESPDPLAGTVISGEVFLTDGSYIPFNSTSTN